MEPWDGTKKSWTITIYMNSNSSRYSLSLFGFTCSVNINQKQSLKFWSDRLPGSLNLSFKIQWGPLPPESPLLCRANPGGFADWTRLLPLYFSVFFCSSVFNHNMPFIFFTILSTHPLHHHHYLNVDIESTLYYKHTQLLALKFLASIILFIYF